jgi:hypothetical protein
MVIDIMTKLGDLKKKSISNLKVGKISLDDGLLLFYLGDRVVNKVESKKSVEMEDEILFNRNGVSSGGKIRLKLSKNYNIMVEAVSGIIKLEMEND